MSASVNHFDIRPDWLASHDEPILDPARPIVDAHHHLYHRPQLRYLLDEYLSDIGTGHDIRASVFVQARAMLRSDGPVELQAVGETEFVNGVAAMSASGTYGSQRVCAGIVGYADLTLGASVRGVLERQIQAGGGIVDAGGRFCGIRQPACWDADDSLLNAAYPTTADMMDSATFRAGFAELAKLGLSFDSWAFFHQLPAVARLARAFPMVPIVVNHMGGVVRVQRYAGDTEMHGIWLAGIREVASCPNVAMKISGLGMRLSAFGFSEQPQAAASQDLAAAWRPWIEPALECFGTRRCMWGSNFPVDKGSYALKIGLNAIKRLVDGASEAERDDLFWRCAARVYRLRPQAFGING